MHVEKIKKIYHGAVQAAQAGDTQRGYREFARIAKFERKSFVFNLQFCEISLLVGEYGTAHIALERVMGCHVPDNDQYLRSAYDLAMTLHRGDLAEKIIEKSDSVDSALGSGMRARFYERTHQLDELDTLLSEKNGESVESRLARVRVMRRRGKLDASLAEMGSLREGYEKEDFFRIELDHEYARLLDATGEYDRAIEVLDEAKVKIGRLPELGRLPEAAQNARQKQEALADALSLEHIRGWQEAEVRGRACDLALVTGHPRSGTTLIERFVDNHPGVTTVEESGALANTVRAAYNGLVRKNRDCPTRASAELLDALSVPARKRLMQKYVDSLHAFKRDVAKGSLVVDRHPLHILNLPLFLALFPEAPIVMILRDPRDVCLSFYMQHLGLNELAVTNTSLEKTAESYMSMMRGFFKIRKMLPGRISEFRYEDFVMDTDATYGAMLSAMGLKSVPANLAPLDTAGKTIVMTPSYDAVVKPVYDSAIGRWKNYRKHFDKAWEILEPAILELGY